jgi:hypothetical protein
VLKIEPLNVADETLVDACADVRAAASGRVVALTDIPIHPADTTDTRWGSTVVAPVHRGLRQREELERIDTATDAANSPMIRVNEQLGFVTARETAVVSRSF